MWSLENRRNFRISRRPLRLLAAALALTSGLGVVTPAVTAGPAAAASSWLQVSTGLYTTCGIKAEHSLWCWGNNGWGQLGVGDEGPRRIPTQVGAERTWASVSVGGSHVCALKTDQTRWCWGKADYGQLGAEGFGGTDGATSSTTPVTATNDGTWLSISAGYDHTCGISTGRRLYCWGNNNNGQLGVGSYDDHVLPARVSSAAWSSVSAGLTFTCALYTNGSRFCWGNNSSGQLGLGDTATRTAPRRITGEAGYAMTTAGSTHACGVRLSGDLYCWGGNASAQLGLDDYVTRKRPTLVRSGWATVAASTLGGDTCGIRADGTRLCWGDNGYGQLGLNDTVDRTHPEGRIVEGPWLSVAVGTHHACGIQARYNELYCWGNNLVGQLGLGDQVDRHTPTLVS